jgi:hypothetical protein
MSGIEVHPVTPDRCDLVGLAGERGFWSGCWCMWWRLTNQELAQQSEPQARAALQRLVAEGQQPGLLAYRDGEPVGWVSVAPREQYRRIEHSTKLSPVDQRPAWAVVCIYVPPAAPPHRGWSARWSTPRPTTPRRTAPSSWRPIRSTPQLAPR